jgi:LmbE family N-acetylglucosaminyl deacetylase
MDTEKSKTVAIIVAHPDDETLWAGGTILSHPSWNCFVVCLSRVSDTERATKFYRSLKVLRSEGIMGDLDDGPEQQPLEEQEVEQAILDLLPPIHFDLLLSHNPSGEYTRHKRHEEVSKAVIQLWYEGRISAPELWTFAYEDGHKAYFPKPVKNAPIYLTLTKRIWQMKYSIITETYGFEKNSWEAKATTPAEAFWQFTNAHEAKKWLHKFENLT